MTYVRKSYLYSRDAPKRKTIYTVYEQPLKNRLAYLVYRIWWSTAWKIKPIDWFIDNVADRIAQHWHDRTCNDDCSRARSVKSDEWFDVCGRMPTTAAMDCKLFDLDMKNNKTVGETDEPKERS